MSKNVIGALLLLLSFSGVASAGDAVVAFISDTTTQNLIVICSSEDSQFKWSDRAYCSGYVMGVWEGANLHPESILAQGVSFNTLYTTMRESIAQHPANQRGNRRLQSASNTLIESWVQAGLITFAPPQSGVIRN